MAMEQASLGGSPHGAANGTPALVPQLVPSPGLPERRAVQRHIDRVMNLLPTLPPAAQHAILNNLGAHGGQPAAGPAPDQTMPQPAAGDRDRAREQAQAEARAQAWRLAREREAAQREAAQQDTQQQPPAGQDKPGGWPADWPGGGG
jgi:phospholipid/cholesterol/gamma-HCH transport system ATP-binding protein